MSKITVNHKKDDTGTNYNIYCGPYFIYNGLLYNQFFSEMADGYVTQNVEDGVEADIPDLAIVYPVDVEISYEFCEE